jgi:uncharacterized protein YpbB
MNRSNDSSNSIKLTELFINQTNRTIFLTGKAGTGKTTLLKKIVETTQKNTVIVAPTGIAALNAGGVTIHSFFQLPFGAFIPEDYSPNDTLHVKHENKSSLKRHFKMNKRRISIIRNLELLIIDEVSMLRADLLDAIDWMLKFVRRHNEPFGGVQVLFIGDLLQLPPVVKNDEWNLLRNYYQGIYFFNSQILRDFPPLVIELTTIFRQQDNLFIDLLNNLRKNYISQEHISILNDKIVQDVGSINKSGYITLSTHNAKADEMNAIELSKIASRSYYYSAEITGDFPEHMFPIEEKLELKIGSQVMFIKNDIGFEKTYYNGKIGEVVFLSEFEITVAFPDEKKKITVEKYEWSNIKYSLNEATQEITEEVIGTFVQYPLKLAWAITIHKSQGLTFEKAILDVADVFAPGQAYVAFSRLRSLDGLKLLTPIENKSISLDQQLREFTQHETNLHDLEFQLAKDTRNYLWKRLTETFHWYPILEFARIHSASYLGAPSKSEKIKNTEWIKKTVNALTQSQEDAVKFKKQLDKLFNAEINLPFISERTTAAYNYFFPIFDGILGELYLKIGQLKLIKKTKQYSDELEEFSEMLLTKIIELKKTRIITEKLAFGIEISQNLFKIPEIENYQISKISSAQQALRHQNQKSKLILDTIDFETKILSNKTKEKTTKQSTSEITLELIQSGMKITEIAHTRQLSESTIYSHITQLIRSEKINLEEVMDKHRISEIQSILETYNGNSLSQIKAKVGEKITWDELRIYQASTII